MAKAVNIPYIPHSDFNLVKNQKMTKLSLTKV